MKELGDIRFLSAAEDLFDSMSDTVFFVKDMDARYITVNQTMVQRCGVESKNDILGKTALEVFPQPMAASYHDEDQRVLSDGIQLRDLLQLHLYVKGGPGWCITTKLPLKDEDGNVVGLSGVSSDIHVPDASKSGYRELSDAVSYIQSHYDEQLRVDALAEMCGLSVYQFEERTKKVFLLTVGQFINKTRIAAACEMLKDDGAISQIALDCGFSDQSAFTRQFKTTTGMTPSEYRSC